MSEEKDFKALLDTTYAWPADYPFKFIVPQAGLQDFLKLFKEVLVHNERPSANGKYVAVNFNLRMNSSDEVLGIYQKARAFPGVISL